MLCMWNGSHLRLTGCFVPYNSKVTTLKEVRDHPVALEKDKKRNLQAAGDKYCTRLVSTVMP